MGLQQRLGTCDTPGPRRSACRPRVACTSSTAASLRSSATCAVKQPNTVTGIVQAVVVKPDQALEEGRHLLFVPCLHVAVPPPNISRKGVHVLQPQRDVVGGAVWA